MHGSRKSSLPVRFANGARTLRSIAPGASGTVNVVGDNRNHKRVPLQLSGRFMRADKQVYPCKVLNMSPSGAALQALEPGEVGEHIVAYINQIGCIEGSLVCNFDGGYSFKFQPSECKREKIANQLSWLASHDPLESPMTVSFDDATKQICRILDVSYLAP